MNLVEKIKERRKLLQITVPNLATMLDIPKSRIQQWEAGRGNPKADDTKKIQEWLDRPIERMGGTFVFQNMAEENIIYLKASVKILTLQVAELISKNYKKSISTVFSSLEKEILLETERLMAEKHNKSI